MTDIRQETMRRIEQHTARQPEPDGGAPTALPLRTADMQRIAAVVKGVVVCGDVRRAIRSEVEEALKTCGLVNGHPMTVEERQREAITTVIEQARQASVLLRTSASQAESDDGIVKSMPEQMRVRAKMLDDVNDALRKEFRL